MRCFLFSTVVVLVFLAGSVPAEDTKEDSLPVGVDTALVSHVQENGLEQVMRVKRYCGCCGGCCGCMCNCATMAAATGCPCMGCCG